MSIVKLCSKCGMTVSLLDDNYPFKWCPACMFKEENKDVEICETKQLVNERTGEVTGYWTEVKE